MNGFTRVAAVAVAVIAIGGLGLAILRPGAGPGSAPAPSPAPTASPTPSPTPDPSAPPPLGSTFTSAVNGISLAYPNGWVMEPATRAWTPADGFEYDSPGVDVLHDKALEASLFLAIASEPLRGKTGEAWVSEFLRYPDQGCGSAVTEPITVDGASGQSCDGLAVFATNGRGYFIRNYTGDDAPWISQYYDQAWFRTVLNTVRLHPVDARSSAAPSASAKPS